MKKIVISAAASGQGKTTVALGIMRALTKKGYKVQPFKVGPDYIDPGFHKAACGRPSVNLDGWLLGNPEDEVEDARSKGEDARRDEADKSADIRIKELVSKYGQDADIAVIEGVMGLYDGAGNDPMDCSTAAVAKLLDAEVLLVISPGASAATSAAVAKGLFDFRDLKAAGVILNGIYSDEHYQSVRGSMEEYAGIKVFGYLPTREELKLGSRHLGLTQSCENEKLDEFLDNLAEVVAENIDLDQIISSLEDTVDICCIQGCYEIGGEQDKFRVEDYSRVEGKSRLVIAVAKDEAFNFYYEENLRMLTEKGAEVEFFSPIRDTELPVGTKGIYFGGGYPEVFAEELSKNKALMKQIKESADLGMPIFAECGGFMYLQKTLKDMNGKELEMVGIFDGKAEMTERLQNFGYNTVESLEDNWLLGKGEKIRGHEFHKSTILRDQINGAVQVCKIRKGKKVNWSCGMNYKNVFGMYPHIYFSSKPELAERFVKEASNYDPK